MKLKLSQNIRAFRKERKMTQEQLAEMLGVTVGAVHKWERGLSTPDITLIMEMASLFETSTDALLGYEWRTGNAGTMLQSIQSLTREKRYDDAAVEAEIALKKYPNHFEIAYHSAAMYLAKGESSRDIQAYQRAIELFEHSCELISQNTDERLSEVYIRSQMARAHLWLGHTDTALTILKKHNACGVNNAFIGMILADILHRTDEAAKYLGLAVESAIADLDSAMIGYANVFFRTGDYDGALECLNWLRNMLRGVQPTEALTPFDKYDCILLETMAEIYCFKRDPENARMYLRRALEKARLYDSTSPGEIHNVHIYDLMKLENQPTYDIYDKTALGSLRRRIQTGGGSEANGDDIPYMLDLWREEMAEVFPDERL